MGALLTAGEYKALAATLPMPANAFIDGAFRPSASGATFTSFNPATGEALAEIAAMDAADVDFAVSKARQAFEDGRWRKRHPTARKEILREFAKLIERNIHELSVLESVDSGKPIAECETVDLPEMIHTIRWHAELIDKIYDQTAPVGADAVAMIVREPIGVVGCVLPWNFPLLMLAWKIGPALASGCSVIVKPAEQTTLSTLRVAELAHEAGIPAGVLNIVTGAGATGEALGLHPDVDMISFTGSTATGRRFLRYAADSNLKRVVLECGGKNPALVLEDAEDLELVAQHVVQGAFWNMGENCSATSRLIVHESVRDELLRRIGHHLNEWRMGDPLDPNNKLGSLISKEHFEKVTSYLKNAGANGGRLLAGGQTQAGAFVAPTIVDGVGPSDALFREEVFGPLLAITTVRSTEEAIALANDTEYGLAASIYSGSLKRALRTANAIRAGTVTINCFGEGDVSTPFGGYRQSGFGGRDKSVHAHEQYTELKTIWIDLSDSAIDGAVG